MFSTENTSYSYQGTYGTTLSFGGRYTATFTSVGAPLVFMEGLTPGQTTYNHCCILSLTDNGSNSWTVVVGARRGTTQIANPPIYVFSAAPSTASGYGIVAFNSSGVATLNSNQKLLKVAALYTTVGASSNASSTPPNETVSVGSIPTDYLVCSPVLGEIIFTAGPQSIFGSMGIRRSSTSDTTMEFLITNQIGVLGAGLNAYIRYAGQSVIFIDRTLYI